MPIDTYIIMRGPATGDQASDQARVAALIEFPQARGGRLMAAIVDTPLEAIAIDPPVDPVFAQAKNGKLPMFRVTTRDRQQAIRR